MHAIFKWEEIRLSSEFLVGTFVGRGKGLTYLMLSRREEGRLRLYIPQTGVSSAARSEKLLPTTEGR